MRTILLLSVPFFGLMACKQAPATREAEPQTVVVKDSTVKKKPVAAVRLVIPGRSIGNTFINENMEKVIKRLGRPDGGDAAMGKSLSTWHSKNKGAYVTMIFASRQMGDESAASVVKQIRVTSPWFVTKEGIHAGSSLADVSKYYQVKKTLSYRDKGKAYTLFIATKPVAFEIDDRHICRGMVISDAAFEPGQTYLPFYDNR